MELVVVLVLVALLAALAAPLLRPPASRADPFTEVVARARRLAVERAEPLALAVRADGGWTLAAASAPATPLLAGTLGAPHRPVAIALSPLGLCVPDDAVVWDPARCAPAAP